MTSGLEMDYSGRMGRDGNARKQIKRIKEGKIKDTKDRAEGGEVKG